MKKPRKEKKSGQDNALAISTTLLEPSLLQCLVEKLASYRIDSGLSTAKIHEGWEAIETSSIEAYASGDIILTNQKGVNKISFDSCFVFTCTKTSTSEYNLVWGNSLS
jgi:hypothetical protein